MIRRCNFTGRRALDARDIRISVGAAPSREISVSWSLSEQALPPQAAVIVEAYTGGSPQILRFPWGTVSAPLPPMKRTLAELDADRFLFDFKVLSPDQTGRIIALASGLRPVSAAAGRGRREELLHVNPRHDMGTEIWNLDFSHDHVWLNVNAKIASFEVTVRDDPRFFALVYPQVVRQVLQRALSESAEEDSAGWQPRWLRWAHKLTGEAPPVSDPCDTELTEEQCGWIDAVVGAFCEQQGVLDKWNGSTEAAR
jgi:hypothetical protein